MRFYEALSYSSKNKSKHLSNFFHKSYLIFDSLNNLINIKFNNNSKIKKYMNFKPAPIIENEKERLKAVDRTGVMYLDHEDFYDIFCYLAKEITSCNLSWTGLIDDKNQFCLANDGLPKELGKILPRQHTFCQYALSRTEPLIVENMHEDKIFKNHPLVEEGFIKFYAGFPIVTGDGYILGTLCVGDSKVKKLSQKKTQLMVGLTAKLGYQLQIQENFRNKNAENLIVILEKMSKKIDNISNNETKIILKFFLNQTLSQAESNLLVEKKIAYRFNDNLKITEFGNLIKNDLSLNNGVLKKVKNMTSKSYDLTKMLEEIDGT